jgi:hypothetical protein
LGLPLKETLPYLEEAAYLEKEMFERKTRVCKTNLMKIAEAESQERLWSTEVAAAYRDDATIVIAPGDCLETLRTLPDGLVKLIITSPPYNLGKA